MKQQLQTTYNTAQLVAQFVGLSMNGKQIPTIQEIFPSVFQEVVEVTESQEERDKAGKLADCAKKSWMD